MNLGVMLTIQNHVMLVFNISLGDETKQAKNEEALRNIYRRSTVYCRISILRTNQL